MVMMVAVVIIACGCTRKVYVPVDRYHIVKDSVERVRMLRDSVIMRDSIYVDMRGDTLLREVYRWRVRDRYLRDTVRQVVRDTVVVREVTEVEEKETDSFTRKVKKSVTWGVMIILLLLTATVGVIRFLYRRIP